YEDVVEREDGGGFVVAGNFYDSVSDTVIGTDLNNALNVLEGYDLIYVNWRDGTDDIRRNALLLENIIQWVNTHKQIDPVTGVREKTKVMGYSMGGVVANYALADLEKRFQDNLIADPELDVLITHDTPHRGANVPYGAQVALTKLTDFALGRFITETGQAGRLTLQQVNPSLRQLENLQDAPATRQLLIYQSERVQTSFLAIEYQQMIDFSSATGYNPPSFRRVALSNGSECGIDQGFNGDNLFFNLRGDAYLGRLVAIAFAGGYFIGVIESDFTARDNLSVNNPLERLAVMPGLIAAITFSGRDWRTAMDIRLIPEVNSTVSRESFYGKVEYRKTLAFRLIKLRWKTIFEESEGMPSGALPYSMGSGGFFSTAETADDLTDDLPNFNALPFAVSQIQTFLKQRFCFIPTYSALDVGEPVSESLLLSSSFAAGNPDFPVPFDNHVVQEPTGLLRIPNAEHLNLFRRSAEWVVDELKDSSRVDNCTHICGEISGEVGIVGPDSLCFGDAAPTFQVFGIDDPSTATYDWQTLQRGIFTGSVSGTSDPSYTPIISASGAVDLFLFVNQTTCPTRQRLRKQVVVSEPLPSNITISPVTLQNPLPTLCDFGTLTYQVNIPNPELYSYDWSFTGGGITQLANDPTPAPGTFVLVTNIGQGAPGTVTVRIASPCSSTVVTASQVIPANPYANCNPPRLAFLPEEQEIRLILQGDTQQFWDKKTTFKVLADNEFVETYYEDEGKLLLDALPAGTYSIEAICELGIFSTLFTH
ncbi:MAG: hypothetical protein AAF740_06850, partial [Bacteroidota bacterium]